ncbi:MAG: YidB family protein [Thiolinea sp.]
MDINKIMQDGAHAFQSKLDADGDGQIEISDLVPALKNLFTNENGDMDVSSMLSNLNADGLSAKVQSWLGSGENEAIEGEQLTNALGMDSISSFASQLGLKVDQAVAGLQEAVPNIIDQASNGAESLMDIAGDLLGGDTSSAAELFGLGDSDSLVSDAKDKLSAIASSAADMLGKKDA